MDSVLCPNGGAVLGDVSALQSELQAHAGQGSNLRPAVLETAALPTELPAYTPGVRSSKPGHARGPGMRKAPPNRQGLSRSLIHMAQSQQNCCLGVVHPR